MLYYVCFTWDEDNDEILKLVYDEVTKKYRFAGIKSGKLYNSTFDDIKAAECWLENFARVVKRENI